MQDNLCPEEVTFKKGDVIFREGDYGMFMFDIMYGSVAIYSKYGTSEEKLLTTLSEGQFFGEMGLIEARPRSATAVAQETTVVNKITSDNFGAYFREKPAKVMSIMQHMSHRIRELSVDYLSACQTISEYLEAEEQHKSKSEGLLARMKKFVGVYKSSK